MPSIQSCFYHMDEHYSGLGGLAPTQHFKSVREWEIRQGRRSGIPKYEEGYNIANYLREIARAALVGLFSSSPVVNNRPQ